MKVSMREHAPAMRVRLKRGDFVVYVLQYQDEGVDALSRHLLGSVEVSLALHNQLAVNFLAISDSDTARQNHRHMVEVVGVALTHVPRFLEEHGSDTDRTDYLFHRSLAPLPFVERSRLHQRCEPEDFHSDPQRSGDPARTGGGVRIEQRRHVFVLGRRNAVEYGEVGHQFPLITAMPPSSGQR